MKEIKNERSNVEYLIKDYEEFYGDDGKQKPETETRMLKPKIFTVINVKQVFEYMQRHKHIAVWELTDCLLDMS